MGCGVGEAFAPDAAPWLPLARFVGVGADGGVGRSTTGVEVAITGAAAAPPATAPNRRKLPQIKIAPRASTSSRLISVRNCP